MARISSASKRKTQVDIHKQQLYSSVGWDPTLALSRVWEMLYLLGLLMLFHLSIAESHVLFKKDVSEQWRRKFPACRLDCNKAGKEGESMPKGWRKPLFKSWPEVEGCVQDRGWLWVRRHLIHGGEQIPNPTTAGKKLSDDPEGMKQELTSRNALKPPGRTGQREDLFTNHLELLLANLFFSSLLSELL